MLKGILLSVLASILFGVLYFYSTLLFPLNGEDIFAWRLVLTLPFMTAFIVLIGEFHLVKEIFYRVCRQPFLFFVLVISSLLIGVQLWLFMWAPPHHKALDVSLGYFMLPLTMVLTGRIMYKERLSIWQKLATFSAFVGVMHELIRIGHFSVEALTVALGYPLYFMVRRYFKLDNLGGFWFDLMLLLPIAVWFIFNGSLTYSSIDAYPNLYWLIPILGVISTCALVSYMVSSKILRLSLFGLLGYVEPILLVCVSFLLGEVIAPSQWLTYIPIWLAVVFLVIEAGLSLRASARE